MKENQKPATTTKSAPAKKVESFDISRSDETLSLATDLAKFIKDNKLTTQVQGKDFVNVEGWQYAGSRLGIVPIVDHVINCSTDQELKYQAKVTLFDMRSGHTVGAGFAVCSNKEQGKKFYQEFAIMSMAQTRAIGKAYRNILAWIIRAAGYEPTPAEEMEAHTGATEVKEPAPVAAPAATPQMTVSRQAAAPSPGKSGASKQATATREASEALAKRNAQDEAAGYVMATQLQKELIITLLNNPKIQPSEKSKMMLNINRITTERADTSIQRLVNAITQANGVLPGNLQDKLDEIRMEAEASIEAAAFMAKADREEAEQELRQFVEANEDRLGRPEVDRLYTICDNQNYTAAQLLEEKRQAVEYLAEEPAA